MTAAPPEAIPVTPTTTANTVLLVEDEPALLMVCRRFLQDLGCTVLTAENSQQALNLVHQHRGDIHLLLTDMIMPEINGRELALRLKPLHPKIRCLFMSGYPADFMEHSSDFSADDDFIAKPFCRQDLCDKVRSMLTKFRP